MAEQISASGLWSLAYGRGRPHQYSLNQNSATQPSAKELHHVDSIPSCARRPPLDLPTAGSWYSVYDATWEEDPSQVHIDHIVPLAEAWDSGADTWSESTRRAFANDLDIAQLIAVSASSNQSKGDRDPAEWIPPNSSVRCIYTRQWIWVKHTYGLSVDSTEKSALGSLLDLC